MKLGDLVRQHEVSNDKLHVQLGTVISVEPAWPGDEYDESLMVTVLESIGKVTKWYDWQLHVIDERDLNDDSR